MDFRKVNIALLIVVILLVLGAITWKVGYQQLKKDNEALSLEITVNGNLFASEKLLTSEDRKEISVPVRSGGQAIVVIDHGSVYVPQMPKELCPLGICSKMGPISRSGQYIICMPNKIIIRIQDLRTR